MKTLHHLIHQTPHNIKLSWSQILRLTLSCHKMCNYICTECRTKASFLIFSGWCLSIYPWYGMSLHYQGWCYQMFTKHTNLGWLDLLFLIKGNIFRRIQQKDLVLHFIKKFFSVTFITDNKKTVKQRLFKQKLELAYDVYLHEQYRCIKPIFCSHKSIGFKQFQRCNNKVFQASPQPNHLKIITYVSILQLLPHWPRMHFLV